MDSKKDDKALISKKVDMEIKKYGTLKATFTKISENELSLSKTRLQSFENIQKIEETDNKYLKEMYSNFSATMSSLENLRKTQMDKVNGLIIPATGFYPEKAKSFKAVIDKISQINKNKSKHQDEIIKAENKKELTKAGQLRTQVTQFENNIIIEGNNLEAKLANFEAERITDNKYLLLHYIHAELAYHATALEKLTTLYGDIMITDPKELLPDFINSYNLNSFKDKDAKLMANQFGYKIGETERRRIEKEKQKDPNYSSNVNILSNQKYTKGLLNVARPQTPVQKTSLINKMNNDDILDNNPIITKGSYSPGHK